MATAVHNNNVNATTKVTPAHALLGYLPTLDPLAPTTTNNERVEDRLAKAKTAREQAQAALDRVADQTPKDQFQEGERVWLEAKNLALPYQTRKLAPKRHGPLTITKQVSPVAYQLEPPPTWTIHDALSRVIADAVQRNCGAWDQLPSTTTGNGRRRGRIRSPGHHGASVLW